MNLYVNIHLYPSIYIYIYIDGCICVYSYYATYIYAVEICPMNSN